ncbi:MAG: glycoside hydrolase family 15 protein, partial [Hymenobacter sp.]
MIKHTYDMGVVGNCAFLALIGTDTAVRWLCWPRFDSSFVFGPLLDEQKGGEFSIKPASQEFTSAQRYLTNTNVLSTEITTAEGSYRVTDFAPRFMQYERYYKPLMLIRKVEPLRGAPRVRVACRPVGQYGEQELTRRRSSNHIAFLGLEEEIRLTTNIPLTYVLDEEDFVLNETKYLVLTYGAPLEAALESTAERFLKSTETYWRNWVKSTSITNFHQSAVIRSALALKIHQYEDTGAIIAASTTSLPEAPGSTRNWDYRYCWMRDTYYTLTAFNNIGHFEEIERYFQYIANISTKVVGKYQPLYGIGGQATLTETELPLAGYQGNQPVRIGNDAYTHIQNDVYGQVLVALLPLYVDCRFRDPERSAPLSLVEECLRLIEATMDQPDAGLWEFRHIAQKHCYTYLFHWAGSHAGRQVARQHGNTELEALATRLLH